MKMENNKRFMTRRAFSMWIKTVACVLSILMMLYAVPTKVLSTIDVAGRDRNAIKNLSWTLNQKAYEHLPDALIGDTIPQIFNSFAAGITGYCTMGGIYGFT